MPPPNTNSDSAPTPESTCLHQIFARLSKRLYYLGLMLNSLHLAPTQEERHLQAVATKFKHLHAHKAETRVSTKATETTTAPALFDVAVDDMV